MPEPKGNYFPIPNEIFNMDLTASEIALYAFLMRMEDRKTYRNDACGSCFSQN